MSDIHIGRENCDEDLQKIVQDINKQRDIKFVVVTGDISNFGADWELKQAKNILSKLDKPWHIIPGNHDTKWSESGCSSFKKIFGSEHFSFGYGKYQFIGCGSGPEMRMGPGMVPRADVVWLDSVIRKASGKPVIYLNHYPVDETLNNWYKIIDILKKGNPQAILCGHGHKNQKLEFEGIPAAMGRSIIRDGENNNGYNIVSIKKDSIFFAERTPLVKTSEIWNRFRLAKVDSGTSQYPRPSYQINDHFTNVKEIWAIQDSSDIVSGMAVSGKYCYYANTRGYVVALDVETGSLIWKFQTKNKIFSTPAVAGNKVVTSSTDGIIYCLNAAIGRLEWKYVTSKPIVASPAIEGDCVYIGSSEGKFRALSLNDGILIWENSEIAGSIESKPLVDKERVYIGSWGSYFYALNKKDGTAVWKWTNGKDGFYSPAACVPVEENGKIFIVDPERYTAALDAKTGNQIWRSNQWKSRESIAISEDGSEIFIKTMQDSLVAISTRESGDREAWSVNCQFGFELDPAPSVERDGIVFVPTDKGCIYAVDRASRAIVWIRKLSNALVNPILPLGNHQLVASTVDGRIFKLEYANVRTKIR